MQPESVVRLDQNSCCRGLTEASFRTRDVEEAESEIKARVRFPREYEGPRGTYLEDHGRVRARTAQVRAALPPDTHLPLQNGLLNIRVRQ